MKLENSPLFSKSGFQLPSLLKLAYPEHKWNRKSFKFGSHYVPSEVYIENIRKSLESLSIELGMKKEDRAAWYTVSYDKIDKAVGHDRLGKFGFSRFKLFSAIYPEHTWHPWLFQKSQGTRIESVDALNVERFGKYLEEELDIKSPGDWYKVTKKDLAGIGLPDLFDNQAEFISFLQSIAPNVTWDQEKMAWSSFGWSHLLSALEQLFPKQIISARDYFGPNSSQSDIRSERVLVVPEHKLVFEYQGPIAYGIQILASRELLTKAAPSLALQLSDKDSFSCIGIPFWWNRESNSLIGEIYRHRPDLFEQGGPLSAWNNSAPTLSPIPDEIERRVLNLNKSFIRSWAERFPRTLNRSLSKRRAKPTLSTLPKTKASSSSSGPSLFLSPQQRSVLVEEFEQEPYPGRVHCEELASRLGLDVQKVLNWFMKKRAMSKGKF